MPSRKRSYAPGFVPRLDFSRHLTRAGIFSEGIPLPMVETLIPIIVTIGSCLLFAYWFRCACLLILVAKTPRDYANGVAIANQLTFTEVQEALRNSPAADLPSLKAALDRDFRLLRHLLKYAAAASMKPEEAIERRMLSIDYWTMAAWCSVNSRVSPPVARRALQEMALVVTHFASTLGEKLAQADRSADLQSFSSGF